MKDFLATIILVFGVFGSGFGLVVSALENNVLYLILTVLFSILIYLAFKGCDDY